MKQKGTLVVIIEQAVDWLRGTTSDKNKYMKMLALFEAAAIDDVANGATRKQRSMLGYDGECFEHGFIGSRNDGYMLQISGGLANEYLRGFLALDLNVTRIDVQCTVRLPEYFGGYGKQELLKAEAERLDSTKGHSKAKLRHIDGRGEGDTVQIGRRVSDKWGRLYDKEKESGQDIYERAWRYEIEYKGEPSRYVAKIIRQDTSPARISSIVATQFAKWGFDVSALTSNRVELFEYRRSNYDKDRTLSWLAKQVSPAIQKLLRSGVCLSEITTCLGLTME